jgi:putative copper resistance protein D
MPPLYWISVNVHVLSAMFWLGGMLFLGVVGAPALRRVEPAPLRQQLFHSLGVRFRLAGWAAITVLLLTGVVNLHYRGLLQWSGVLDDPEFWATPVGRALAAKLVLVTIMLVVSAVHDFVLGPAAGRATAGSPDSLRFRRRAALLARANALAGVLLVLAATRLARG